MLTNLIMKLFGKKVVEDYIVKHKISRTKIIAVVAGCMFIAEKVLPAFDVHVAIPKEVYELLGATGLWTFSDKLDSQPMQPPIVAIEPPTA